MAQWNRNNTHTRQNETTPNKQFCCKGVFLLASVPFSVSRPILLLRWQRLLHLPNQKFRRAGQDRKRNLFWEHQDWTVHVRCIWTNRFTNGHRGWTRNQQGVPGRKKGLGEGEIEGRGRRRRRCEGGKGPTQGKSLTRVAEGTRIPLYFDHLSKC